MKCHLFFICIYMKLLFSNEAYGGVVVSADTAIIQGVYGESATIIFVTNASVALGSFQVFFNNNSIRNALARGVGNGFEISSNLPDKLKGRTIVSYSDGRYNISITNLQFTDEFQLLGKAFWEVGLNAFSEEASSRLEVFGGPFNCGEPLPKNITINGMSEPHNKSISIVLCGKQEPRVYWFISGEKINTGVNSTKIGSHQYLYEVNFINQTLCGGVLSYNATGHGKDISGSTNLLVDFRPPRINILHSYRKGLCILTSWQKINIANCSGLEYQINYIYQNSTVQKFLTSMTTDKHSYCVSNLKTAGNISQVEIRGIFRKNLGLLSMKNVSFNSTMVNVTKRPTAVVTPVSGPSSNAYDEDDALFIVIGICGGLGLTSMIIIIVVVFCWYRRRQQKKWKYQSGSAGEYRIGSQSNKKSSKRKSKSKSSYENNGMDYAEPGKDVVYVPDLNYYDPKEFGIEDNSDTLNMKPNGTEKFAEYAKVMKLKDDEASTLSKDSNIVIATTRSNASTPLPIETPSTEHENIIKSGNDSVSIASVRDFRHPKYGDIV